MRLEPHHAAGAQAGPGWTYLQVAYPRPFDPGLVLRQMARYGDEMLMHHEMARLDGVVQIFALPLVRWTTSARMYEIIAELEADGCTIYDPHAITIEDGGMKEIDARPDRLQASGRPRSA